MVQPLSFGFDQQTAETNTFQTKMSLSRDEVLQRANDEFAAMVAGLRARDITVQVYQDAGSQDKPNAVFPNNWLSMWPDGTTYLYPMATESRRRERSSKVLDELAENFKVSKTIDVSESEHHGRYLESTGVMIFDHLQRVVYGCLSERCDEQLLTEHAKLLGYAPVVFHAYDAEGAPIYHTNVMMSLQTDTAVICAESISSDGERQEVIGQIKATGRDVIEITQAQMAAFCGNVLELQNEQGERFLAMSQTAYDHFTSAQRDLLAKDKTLLPFAIPTIETIGGGSVRCMLAEIFLPKIR